MATHTTVLLILTRGSTTQTLHKGTKRWTYKLCVRGIEEDKTETLNFSRRKTVSLFQFLCALSCLCRHLFIVFFGNHLYLIIFIYSFLSCCGCFLPLYLLNVILHVVSSNIKLRLRRTMVILVLNFLRRCISVPG